MAASVFGSELYNRLFPVGEVGKLFTDTAEVRAMLLVEGALAKVQGDLGLIPAESAAFIHRSAMELQVDPGGLAASTAEVGNAVPAMVAAFAKLMEAPEHAEYLHFTAAAQDISDTSQMLRLRQFLTHAGKALEAFGADHTALATLRDELPALRAQVLRVSFSGTDATKSAEVRAALGKALNLPDPQCDWHADRSGLHALGDWVARVAQALADWALTQPAGVHAAAITALTGQINGFNDTLRRPVPTSQIALFVEALVLPQLCLCLGSAFEHAAALQAD
jgi:3-carboxy-cis,cis-muconate cycloisomerase